MKVSPLRQRMLDVLQLHGCAASTIKSYTQSVAYLSRYYHRSPDKITPDEIQQWLLWLLQVRHISPSTYRLYFNGIRFLYVFVLEDTAFSEYQFTLPKRQQRLPDLLTRSEVDRLISQPENEVHRLLLLSAYACGLRVSELVHIRVSDIDSERHQLHVVQGKGHKDRYVPISSRLLLEWRRYWQQYHPVHWLFPSPRGDWPINVSTPQKVYQRSKSAAGIRKHGGIHSLRHAFATHSLQSGMPIHQLQRILGHQHLSTTSRYTHWDSNNQAGGKCIDLIGGLSCLQSCSV